MRELTLPLTNDTHIPILQVLRRIIYKDGGGFKIAQKRYKPRRKRNATTA